MRELRKVPDPRALVHGPDHYLHDHWNWSFATHPRVSDCYVLFLGGAQEAVLCGAMAPALFLLVMVEGIRKFHVSTEAAVETSATRYVLGYSELGDGRYKHEYCRRVLDAILLEFSRDS